MDIMDQIDAINETIDVACALIVMHDMYACRRIKDDMIARDYPCGIKYHVTTQRSFHFLKHISKKMYNVVLLSNKCSLFNLLIELDNVMVDGNRYVFTLV